MCLYVLSVLLFVRLTRPSNTNTYRSTSLLPMIPAYLSICLYLPLPPSSLPPSLPPSLSPSLPPSLPSPSRKRFFLGCSSTFMRLAKYPTAPRAWCRKMSAWSVKTRRAPSRFCRGARVYRYTTTAMHDSEYTPSHPLPSLPSLPLISPTFTPSLLPFPFLTQPPR